MRHQSRTALMVAILLASSSAFASERPLIAVLDFDGSQAKLSNAEVVELTEIARKEALDQIGSHYRIITRENLVDLLKSHGKTLEKCQGECETETGRLIGADVVVSGAVRKVYGEYRLGLKAHDTDTKDVIGIEKASSKKKHDLPKLIGEVASKLYGRLLNNPGGDGDSDREWSPQDNAGVLVSFESDPPGAIVLVDGKLLCQSTPCKKELDAGMHTVEMQKERHLKRTTRKTVTRGTRIKMKLEPDFGHITVSSEPPGLKVLLNGKAIGTTPTEPIEVRPGRHLVQVTGSCLRPSQERVRVRRGRQENVNLKPKKKPAGLQVRARDKSGNDIAANVYIDGLKKGVTPNTFKVTTCAELLEVRHPSHGSFESRLELREKKTRAIVANLVKSQKERLADIPRPVWKHTKGTKQRVVVQIEGTALSKKDKADLFTVIHHSLSKYPAKELAKPVKTTIDELMMTFECSDVDAKCLAKLGKQQNADIIFYVQVDGWTQGVTFIVRAIRVSDSLPLYNKSEILRSPTALAGRLDRALTLVFGTPSRPKITEGRLVIESTIPGARIYVNGKYAGSGRIRLKWREGNHEVRVAKDGYLEEFFLVDVTAGVTTRHVVTLKPIEEGRGSLRKDAL